MAANSTGAHAHVSSNEPDDDNCGSSSSTNICTTPEEGGSSMHSSMSFQPSSRTGRSMGKLHSGIADFGGFAAKPHMIGVDPHCSNNSAASSSYNYKAPPQTFMQSIRRLVSYPEVVQPLLGLSRYIKALFVLYIFVSLLYTLAHFYMLFQNNFYGKSPSYTSTHISSTIAGTSSGIIVSSDQQRTGSVIGKILIDNQPSSTSNDNYGVIATPTDSLLFEEVSDNLLFSKMFQYALQPTKVIPYFFRMPTKPDKADITITTIITLERLQVLNNLINKYRGPISVAVHIDDDDQKLQAIEQLHYFHKTNPFFAQYVDLHLIIDKFDRQFNYWRNVARFFARTDLIMTADVDFLLCRYIACCVFVLQIVSNVYNITL